MSQRFPADRVIVDKDRKIVDPWLGPLKRLEPLLPLLTTENITTLQALIQAAQDAGDEDPFSLSAAIAALAVDNSPDFSADYAVTYDTGGNAAKRLPLALLGSGTLLSTTTLSGNTTADISLPATSYQDVELRFKAISNTASDTYRIQMSEDGGTTMLSQSIHDFNHSASNAGTLTSIDWSPFGIAAANSGYGRMRIFDYRSSENKYVDESGIVPATPQAWVGVRLVTSSAPLNLFRFSVSTGAFDAGTIELWGMP